MKRGLNDCMLLHKSKRGYAILRQNMWTYVYFLHSLHTTKNKTVTNNEVLNIQVNIGYGRVVMESQIFVASGSTEDTRGCNTDGATTTSGRVDYFRTFD